MKNSLTIALGTIVGVLALCALTTLCLVGAVILSGPHGTPTPIGIVSPLEPPSRAHPCPHMGHRHPPPPSLFWGNRCCTTMSA
jgi:hypothetical protein